MEQFIRYVAIGERNPRGNVKCEDCGEWMRRVVPYNYPQVCYECADQTVWHYCDREPQKAKVS